MLLLFVATSTVADPIGLVVTANEPLELAGSGRARYMVRTHGQCYRCCRWPTQLCILTSFFTWHRIYKTLYAIVSAIVNFWVRHDQEVVHDKVALFVTLGSVEKCVNVEND